jgi:hypothetical protein
MILREYRPFKFAIFFLLFCSLTFAMDNASKMTGVLEVPGFELSGNPLLVDPMDLAKSALIKKVNGFVKQGVPEEALRRALGVFLKIYGQKLSAKATRSVVEIEARNDRYIGIADYTLPSTRKRFYLLDLLTGRVEKHYVSHGKKTGFKWAQFFSNIPNSEQTSLGIFITGPTYQSKAFESTAMKIYGLEATNFNAYSRNIVIHQADYASPLFIERIRAELENSKEPKGSPRLGRSAGCFAFDPAVAQNIIEKLKNGALIYSYVKGGSKQIAVSPESQSVIRFNPALDTGVDTEEEILQRVIQPKQSSPSKPDDDHKN